MKQPMTWREWTDSPEKMPSDDRPLAIAVDAYEAALPTRSEP